MIRKWVKIGLDRISFSTILSIVMGCFAIYAFYFQNAPDLRFEVISSTSVLDVKEDVSKLQVFYDGQNITKSDQVLRVIVLRAVNKGWGDIRLDSYDSRAPLGFSVQSTTSIRPEFLEASSDYLRENVELSTKEAETVVYLEPVIIDSGEWFTIKLLVIHSRESIPKVESFGKIAGLSSVEVVDLSQESSNAGFLYSAFSGSLLIQAARIVPYSIAFFLVLIFLAATHTVYKESSKEVKRILGKTRRNTIADEFFSQSSDGLQGARAFLSHYYREHGRDRFLDLCGTLLSAEYLSCVAQTKLHSKQRKLEERAFQRRFRIGYNLLLSQGMLTDEGMLIKENKPLIRSFADFVKEKQVIEKRIELISNSS